MTLVKNQPYTKPWKTIVIKEAGRRYWSGRGSSGYAPAEYQVYEVVEDRGMGEFVVRPVVIFPVSGKGA